MRNFPPSSPRRTNRKSRGRTWAAERLTLGPEAEEAEAEVEAEAAE